MLMMLGLGYLSLYGYSLRGERSGNRILVWASFPHQSRLALGPTQPPIQWVQFLPGVKQPRLGDYHQII